jgi:hypothetical protein
VAPCGRLQGPVMSKWKEEKAEKNRRSLVRLNKALPSIFPSAVLSRALGRPFVPPTPRLAIDSYWGAHPLRADRLACSRCPQWSTKRLELAPRRQSQGRTAGHVQNTTRTLSGTGICAWSRLLLRVRPTRLSLRLARRSVGGRDKQERSLALRLRGRMAIVEYPK